MPSESFYNFTPESSLGSMSTSDRAARPAAKLQRTEAYISLADTAPSSVAASERLGQNTVRSSSSSNDSDVDSDGEERKDERKRVRSQGQGGASGPGLQETKPSKFIIATYRMLNDPNNFHAIRFSTDGLCIEIKNGKALSQTILSNYFNHNNPSSFTRQLHNYGFEAHASRKEDSTQIFSHPFFIKGREDLLVQVKRCVTQSSKGDIVQKLKESRQSEEALMVRLRDVEYERNLLAEQVRMLAEENRQLRIHVQRNHPVGPSRSPPQLTGSVDLGAGNPQYLRNMHSSGSGGAQRVVGVHPPHQPHVSGPLDVSLPREAIWHMGQGADSSSFLHDYPSAPTPNTAMSQPGQYQHPPLGHVQSVIRIGNDGASGVSQLGIQFGSSDQLWFDDEPPSY